MAPASTRNPIPCPVGARDEDNFRGSGLRPGKGYNSQSGIGPGQAPKYKIFNLNIVDIFYVINI